MRKLFIAAILLTGFSCKKDKKPGPGDPVYYQRCGTILATPTLDSFIYPTYYITAIIQFPEGNQIVHFHGNVTGNHDGSWYLSKYDRDSTYCTDPIIK